MKSDRRSGRLKLHRTGASNSSSQLGHRAQPHVPVARGVHIDARAHHARMAPALRAGVPLQHDETEAVTVGVEHFEPVVVGSLEILGGRLDFDGLSETGHGILQSDLKTRIETVCKPQAAEARLCFSYHGSLFIHSD